MLNSIKLSVYFCNRNFSSIFRVEQQYTSMKWIFSPREFSPAVAFKQKHRSFVRRLSVSFPASYPIRISGRNSLLLSQLWDMFCCRDSYSLGQTLESFVLLKLIKVIHGVGKLFEGKKVAENLVFFLSLFLLVLFWRSFCQKFFQNIAALKEIPLLLSAH